MVGPVGEHAGNRTSAPTRSFAIALAALVLISVLTASAQQDARTVRSAFVYNLTKYVAWPQSKRTLVVGFIGDQRTGTTMKQMLDGKSADGQTLHVLLNPPDSELAACDILYVTSAESGKLTNILPRLGRTATLTIGEDAGFPRRGGMVGLIRSGDQIQIQVNLEAVHAARLRISSRLLDLATIVSTRSH